MKNQLTIALVACSAVGASAGTVYTSEASLVGAMSGGYALNDFNSEPAGSVTSLSYSVGDFAYEISSGPVTNSGLYNEGGAISTASALDSLVISFTSGNVRAIGANIWATDPGFDPAGALMIITLSDGTIEAFPSGGPSAFYGYTSDVDITSVEIRALGFFVPRYATMDNLYVGTNVSVVPLPAAAWAGLGMLGLLGGIRAGRSRR